MEVLVFAFIGVVAAAAHLFIGEHRLTAAAAFPAGILAAWAGALFASAFHSDGWASLGALPIFGAALSAAAALAILERGAERRLRRSDRGR